MEEEVDYERLKAEVRKIRYNLFEVKTEMTMGMRLKLLNIMRYNLGLIEDKERVKKVVYDSIEKKLRYSESIEIGIAIAVGINDEIRKAEGEEQVELWKVMKETYYYLGRYLFEYYLVALEFGIPPERQFIAPRTMVLNPLAREYSKFYYRTDRPIMTVSMPQGTGKTQILKEFLSWAIGKDPDKPNMFVSYSAAIAKDKGYNGIDAIVHDDMGNYGKIFPNLHELYRSAQDLVLDYSNDPNRKRAHSEYTIYFVGFDGSITGRTRAHNILACDDLVKDIEEASNKDIMDKKWVEFTGTLKKRMQRDCKLLLNGTIFSDNDPLSRTIKYYKEHAPERLIQIRIPGLNENNESNFNYKYGYAITTEMFLEDKDLMDPVSFSCLIQQNPIERAGLLFFEEEFKKYDLREYKRNELEYERTVAYCDVAWGGEDHLSMPIVDEYKNGDCPAVHWVFMQGSKDETMPKVVEAIITYGVTYVCFEANNGGDMYAEAVEKELKKRGHVCYVTSAKSPTNKSKLDRILAAQGFIKGADASEYRLIIPIRESIRGDKQFNEALNEVFAFNQSTAKNVRTKQHDDAPDSCAGLATNVLGVDAKVGRAVSTISRDMLGI